MIHGDFKDLTRRTASDKVLPDKIFNIAENQKYDRYHCEIASMIYIVFVKKASGGAVTRAQSETSRLETLVRRAIRASRSKPAIENKIVSNQHLAEESHKTNY